MPHSKGFRGKEERTPEAVRLGKIVDGLMTRREFRAGAAIGRLMSSWEEVVGERLAAETVPTALDGGTLVIAASSGAWAAQVRFLSTEVLEKANGLLGSRQVQQVRVTVRKAL